MLIFMLILVTAASYALVSKLNAARKPYVRDLVTSRALADAKEALISYAVTYPDTHNNQFGPGYLPCPDISNNGSTSGGCSFGTTFIGRFPWKTLKSNDFTDSSGQRLWYAISENYRNNSKLEPLNSDTLGQLTLDGVGDIVAVIIAPGEPVGNQNRDTAELDITNEIANYLEGENADIGATFDVDFVTLDAGDFNDKVIAITRQELMKQVEKRVLGEVNQILSNYFSIYGAYPWLSTFADPKTTEKRLTGEHSGSDDQSTSLTDSSVDFAQWGVANGDAVMNITDGSYGVVTAIAANTLTFGGGLSFGAENDFDTDDEYFVDVTAVSSAFTGIATATSALVLNDATKNFSKLGIRVGDVLENITDGSSGIIEDISTTQLTVKALTGGANNTFTTNDNYQIRTSMGRATAGSTNLVLEDTNVDFTMMGIQAGDLIRNITDGSYGRVTSVAATPNRLTVSELLFGEDNTFSLNDYYSLPRFNSVTNVREGLLGIHEVAEPFKTDINFDWTFTVAAADLTILNSAILQNYIQNYAAAGSEVFDDSVGTCIWYAANYVDCFASYKDFVNISGNLTSGNNTAIITDATAAFNTDNVKRGDIAQNYDDETLVLSGTVGAGNSGSATADTDTNGLTLEDTNNNFTNVDISVGTTIFNTTDNSSGTISAVSANQITVSALTGGTDNTFEAGDNYTINGDPRLYDASADFSIYERYSYVIQNNTLEGDLGEGKIQGVISDTIGTDILEAQSYVGEGTEPIIFRPGDSYQIYEPRQFVVETVSSETQLTTDNYTSSIDPDFDNGEYYRIMPAGNSISELVEFYFDIGAPFYDLLVDSDGDFINQGVEVGDIVEDVMDGSFGEINSVAANFITARLYGGTTNTFTTGGNYIVYHDYVYSREHTLHARFSGNQGTRAVSEKRVRDVCLGYNTDCSTISAAVNFSGNGGENLITINDYQEDETTNVGTATFRPTNLSSGNLLVSNIDFGLSVTNGDIPSWFINNGWHKLIYVAVSPGDAPGASVVCAGEANCLWADFVKSGATTRNKTINALVIAAGAETNKTLDSNCSVIASTVQDRTNGTINEYFESENCDQSDDLFQKQSEADDYNDQVFILATSP